MLNVFKWLNLDSHSSQSIQIRTWVLEGSSDIPKEHTPGLMPVWGGARGQNLGHICDICISIMLTLYTQLLIYQPTM